ncbi:MAG: SGNH/GDSL hydrolase family protein [Planctomycetota bacterium]
MNAMLRACLFALLTIAPTAVTWADDFALRDGDTVVFLGDSITAARSYGKMIENYTLLRFPQRKVRFINAGIGGDTAAGGLKRIERDVFAHKATVLIVAFGTNDIGWGVYADDEHKQTYLNAVKGIVTACRQRDVRVYICSAAVTGADPEKSEESFLQKMCDEGMALSKSLGGDAIDVQRSMREIQKRVVQSNTGIKDSTKHNSLHVADGVHLNDLGQFAMAYAILKGLNAPAEVSSATLDAADAKVLAATGCSVTEVTRADDRFEFTRLDEGLPFNYGIFFGLHFRFVPALTELSQYLLTVKHLPEGRYDLTVDGRAVGTFTAKHLADGLNIASHTANGWEPGGPWNTQANVLLQLTNARHELATAGLLANLHTKQGDLADKLSRQSVFANEQLESLQRSVAQPRPYRFVIEPAAKK